MSTPPISQTLLRDLREGMVIPAVPLALDASRRFDPRRQRALLRYYVDAGVGGVAVAVHSTQFEIRDPGIALLEPVLALASEAAGAWARRRGREVLLIAGVCGPRAQALAEADLARRLGYHAALVSLAALGEAPVEGLVAHCRAVAEILPILGFYLQPAVGGRHLPYDFWREFALIENAVAIKVAPFDRYETLQVARAVCDAGRADDLLLYTGNDDTIVSDLLTEFHFPSADGERRVRMAGGLLGHWGVWTARAVELMDRIRALRAANAPIPSDLLALGAQITEMNAAVFDAANRFAGCIPGIHEVLRRGGLFEGTWCLDPGLRLSPGQADEITRVSRTYPDLTDDAFVSEHLAEWLDA